MRFRRVRWLRTTRSVRVSSAECVVVHPLGWVVAEVFLHSAPAFTQLREQRRAYRESRRPNRVASVRVSIVLTRAAPLAEIHAYAGVIDRSGSGGASSHACRRRLGHRTLPAIGRANPWYRRCSTRWRSCRPCERTAAANFFMRMHQVARSVAAVARELLPAHLEKKRVHLAGFARAKRWDRRSPARGAT